MKLVLVIVTFALGCGDASKHIEALADRACACADKACVETVVDDLVAFAKEHKTARGDEARAAKAAERMMRCAIKAGADANGLMAKLKLAGE